MKAIHVHVLLRTEETSALLDVNVQTTRPWVVKEILDQCAVAAETRGGSAQVLRLTDAERSCLKSTIPIALIP
jgi:hypothetical protein